MFFACYLMRTSQLRLFIGFTLLLALDLILRNYNGIRHDSILYFGQGLRELNPEAFKNDLFFEFGSQSSYTVFPQLLGWALTYWTPGQISRAGLLIGFVMYLAGSWTVVRRLYAQTWPQGAFVALVLLVAWPLGYGGFNVFRFHEPYLTARTYAEPLVLFSLSMLLAGKQLWALVFVAAASLLHPLQALPGWGMWMLWVVWGRKHRILTLGLICALVLATAALGVYPFSRLFERFDPVWLEAIREPNKNVFILQWPLQSVMWAVADVFNAAIAARYLKDSSRKLTFTVLTAAGGGFLLTLLGADMLQLVLPTGAQFWRAQWLLHWVAVGVIPLTLIGLLRENDENSRLRLFLYIATQLLACPSGALSSVYGVAFTIPLFLLLPYWASQLGRRYRLALYIFIGLSCLISYGRFAAYIFNSSRASDDNWIFSYGIPLASHPLMLSALAAVIWILWKKRVVALHRLAPAAPAIAVFALAISVTQWDRRPDSVRDMEEDGPFVRALRERLPGSTSVYWYENLIGSWVGLRRGSYWSALQEAGLLFNRGTALAAEKRREQISAFEFQAFMCDTMRRLNEDVGNLSFKCLIDRAAAADICKKSEGKIDYIISTSRVDAPEWFAIDDKYSRRETGRIYVYNCGQLQS